MPRKMTPRPNETMEIKHPWTDEEVKPSEGLTKTPLSDKNQLETKTPKSEYKIEIVWKNVIVMSYFHLAALYGLYLVLSFQCGILTLVLNYAVMIAATFGVTAGAHRLWAHKGYKVNTPLKLILIVLQTMAVQNSIYVWCRDHRVHHKYTETDADPHNAKRGFFFSHVGWLLVKKHPDVTIKGKTIDMSDLTSDPLIMFQDKYYPILSLLLGLALPSWLGWVMGNTFSTAYHASMFRYILNLNLVWCVNSAAHLYGSHPYDASINPAENSFVGYFGLGEGWHNFHHTFPWDYRASELSPSKYNFTARQIDRFARIGWAYDLKTVPKSVLMQRIARTGDGTYEEPPVKNGHDEHGHVHSGPWGWGDPDTPVESTKITQILFPQKQG